ncbi:MAG: MobA protein [Prolixibacteraceae bacterium]|nr:MobA protein [Prolixibacteraceae bacterium]
MENEKKTSNKRRKGGRPQEDDPATNCVMVRFNNVEYVRFLTLFEQSGMGAKALFVKARVFDQTFRVVKTDRAALEYATKLTSFYAQYRAIGVNYNQVVKELHSHFSEKKTLALLYKLESITKELVVLSEQIVRLSQEFQRKFLNPDDE